jgi:4-amino-4-deoxy-L-arabinose transferase-like glycosyltransferase|tara:strand:- start:941 stop:2425 length:1485 start_codon:yes stop_codon:yes gene_type:complete
MYRKIIARKYKSRILLVSILIFALALRLIFFTGIGPSDSLSYTATADMLAEGESIGEERAYGLRLGIIFPVSALYSIFGVNEFSSNILTLLISLASIVLIYNFGKFLFNDKVALLSAFLLSFFPFDVVYSTRLMTDLPSAFFVASSVYFFLKSEKINKITISNWYLIFSGLFLGIAYLIRELSLLIGLFFLIYFIYNKKIRSRYLFIVLGFFVIISFELLYFLIITGNPLFRYLTSSSGAIANIIATNMYGRGSLPFSLLHYPYIILTDNLLGLFYPFIFIAIVFCIVNKKKETHNLLFWFIPLLLYISFGSISLTRYIPIPASARFLSIITIPGILLLSYFLMQNENLIKRVLMAAIVLLLLTTSIGYIYISEHRFSLDDERSMYKYLEMLPEKEIYTDFRSAGIFDYLSGYRKSNIKRFNTYDNLKPENINALNLSQIEDSYVILNWEMNNYLLINREGIKFPEEIFNIPQEWILKKKIDDGENRIEIYYIP